MLTLKLPWPPSVNTYYRNVVVRGRPRTLISSKGRAYKDLVTVKYRHLKPMTGRLCVVMELYPPDKRVIDCDNRAKAAQDSLTSAGVWKDDSQIDILLLIRKKVTPPGHVIVSITEIP